MDLLVQLAVKLLLEGGIGGVIGVMPGYCNTCNGSVSPDPFTIDNYLIIKIPSSHEHNHLVLIPVFYSNLILYLRLIYIIAEPVPLSILIRALTTGSVAGNSMSTSKGTIEYEKS